MKNSNHTAKSKIKSFFKIFLISILSIIAVCHLTCFIKTFINYDHNKQVWQEYNHSGIISNQHDFEKLYFGFGNIAKNGCGAISVYNILCMENKEPDLPNIIRQFDLNGENIFGLGGSKPFRVISVLKSYGFDVNYTLNKNKFSDIAQNSKYCIYLYFGFYNNTPFGHYQLFYNFDGEKYDTINITGKYTLDEILDVEGTIFTMMIGVNI